MPLVGRSLLGPDWSWELWQVACPSLPEHIRTLRCPPLRCRKQGLRGREYRPTEAVPGSRRAGGGLTVLLAERWWG
jgi:hypothetical protein